VKRVILEDPGQYFGMDHADHAGRSSGPAPLVFCDYSESRAWASERNVFEVTDEEYERWQTARQAWELAQREIRGIIMSRGRN
jgi:hypothetical protein